MTEKNNNLLLTNPRSNMIKVTPVDHHQSLYNQVKFYLFLIVTSIGPVMYLVFFYSTIKHS